MHRFKTLMLALLLTSCSNAGEREDEPAGDAALLDAAVHDGATPEPDSRVPALDAQVGLDGAQEAALSDGATGDAAGPALPGYRLVWSDEFDGASGSSPDPERWQFDVGTGDNGWGNQQLEYDTARPENAALNGLGQLVITARKESYMSRSYTSARMHTRGKLKQRYGRFEARMKLPYGQGMWPAFWMLGDNLSSVGWPSCGEIDVMENVGKEPDTIHGTLHGPGYAGAESIGKAFKLQNGQRFADAFHVFTVEWEETSVRWYVDGVLYQTRTPSDLAGKSWVYDHAFFLLLNLAVGGLWPGNPDATTTFPQQMLVDYVRVYERAS